MVLYCTSNLFVNAILKKFVGLDHSVDQLIARLIVIESENELEYTTTSNLIQNVCNSDFQDRLVRTNACFRQICMSPGSHFKINTIGVDHNELHPLFHVQEKIALIGCGQEKTDNSGLLTVDLREMSYSFALRQLCVKVKDTNYIIKPANSNDLLMSCLLEDINEIVGGKNLFKRSLLLIQLWCRQEAGKFSKLSPLLLATLWADDALLTLTICLFATRRPEHSKITSPVQALVLFLYKYGHLDWGDWSVTAAGMTRFATSSCLSQHGQCVELFEACCHDTELALVSIALLSKGDDDDASSDNSSSCSPNKESLSSANTNVKRRVDSNCNDWRARILPILDKYRQKVDDNNSCLSQQQLALRIISPITGRNILTSTSLPSSALQGESAVESVSGMLQAGLVCLVKAVELVQCAEDWTAADLLVAMFPVTCCAMNITPSTASFPLDQRVYTMPCAGSAEGSDGGSEARWGLLLADMSVSDACAQLLSTSEAQRSAAAALAALLSGQEAMLQSEMLCSVVAVLLVDLLRSSHAVSVAVPLLWTRLHACLGRSVSDGSEVMLTCEALQQLVESRFDLFVLQEAMEDAAVATASLTAATAHDCMTGGDTDRGMKAVLLWHIKSATAAVKMAGVGMPSSESSSSSCSFHTGDSGREHDSSGSSGSARARVEREVGAARAGLLVEEGEDDCVLHNLHEMHIHIEEDHEHDHDSALQEAQQQTSSSVPGSASAGGRHHAALIDSAQLHSLLAQPPLLHHGLDSHTSVSSSPCAPSGGAVAGVSSQPSPASSQSSLLPGLFHMRMPALSRSSTDPLQAYGFRGGGAATSALLSSYDTYDFTSSSTGEGGASNLDILNADSVAIPSELKSMQSVSTAASAATIVDPTTGAKIYNPVKPQKWVPGSFAKQQELDGFGLSSSPLHSRGGVGLGMGKRLPAGGFGVKAPGYSSSFRAGDLTGSGSAYQQQQQLSTSPHMQVAGGGAVGYGNNSYLTSAHMSNNAADSINSMIIPSFNPAAKSFNPSSAGGFNPAAPAFNPNTRNYSPSMSPSGYGNTFATVPQTNKILLGSSPASRDLMSYPGLAMNSTVNGSSGNDLSEMQFAPTSGGETFSNDETFSSDAASSFDVSLTQDFEQNDGIC